MATKFVGYFPGKKLGWSEDLPKGNVDQWHARRKHPEMVFQLKQAGVRVFFGSYPNKLLTLFIDDDPIGSYSAVRRLHDLFSNADRTFETIRSGEFKGGIGHFGFFRSRFEETLWHRSKVWFTEQMEIK